jgi:2-dehydro-3-deoxyphosphogluconate aldolase / (4S)-4-hydroxy-2-oxoglutarate aldolase
MIAPAAASAALRVLVAPVPVIPVLVIDDVRHARPLAEALVAGGLPVIEVTFRTPAAAEALAALARVPGAVVGAGTLLTPADVARAVAAGARFGVSPGATEALLDAAEAAGLPMLPGVATASEAMRLAERGYDVLKFFPAEAAGGVPALKALAGPLPGLAFCPTGGVTADSAPAYLALPNVPCVGGSWLAPRDSAQSAGWDSVTRRARAARALRH